MPDVSLARLAELSRARVIGFLVKNGLLPTERANMLRSWKHSGLNIHRSQRVAPGKREDMERVAQDIIRNPFWVEKMRPNSSGDSIIHRSGMNPRIGRNLEVFSPCDFIVRITQHIPDDDPEPMFAQTSEPRQRRGALRKPAFSRISTPSGKPDS